MKKIVIILGFFIGSFLFFSCAKDAKEKVQTDNSNFEVELLFEKDGCKMYRFYDASHYIYWSNCKGSVQYNTGGKADQKVLSVNE